MRLLRFGEISIKSHLVENIIEKLSAQCTQNQEDRKACLQTHEYLMSRDGRGGCQRQRAYVCEICGLACIYYMYRWKGCIWSQECHTKAIAANGAGTMPPCRRSSVLAEKPNESLLECGLSE